MRVNFYMEETFLGSFNRGFIKIFILPHFLSFLGFPGGSSGKEYLQHGRPGFDPWVGKIPWRRNGYPLQDPSLGNSMNCIAHGVAKSQT